MKYKIDYFLYFKQKWNKGEILFQKMVVNLVILNVVSNFSLITINPISGLRLSWYNKRTLCLKGYIPCKTCANKDRQELVDEINLNRKVDPIT